MDQTTDAMLEKAKGEMKIFNGMDVSDANPILNSMLEMVSDRNAKYLRHQKKMDLLERGTSDRTRAVMVLREDGHLVTASTEVSIA